MGAKKPRGRNSDIVAEYSRLAAEYDSRWSFYVAATTDETLKRLPLHESDRVLDIGCGTGFLLERLSATHPVEALSGVDPVPQMLAVARRRLSPAVRLREGWAEALPFESESFDVAVSCSVFHYIGRPALALREIGRVLRPGGTLIISDWCHDFPACRALGVYLRLRRRPLAQIYSERDCVRLLRESGFTVVTRERYKISWLWGMMTIGATRP